MGVAYKDQDALYMTMYIYTKVYTYSTCMDENREQTIRKD